MSDVAAPAAPAAPSTPSNTTDASAPAGTVAAHNAKIPASQGGTKGQTAPKADASAEPTEKAEPKPPAKKKFQGKVDGEDFEVELSDDELAREVQMARAARKRMQEAAELKKWKQSIEEKGKKDPRALLKELAGIENPDEWAAQQYAESIKKELMSPEERAAAEKDAQLAEYKSKVEAYEREQQEKVRVAQEKHLEQQIEHSMMQAFEASGLSWEPENVQLFGQIALDALEYGVELTPQQLAAEAKSRLEGTSKAADERVMGRIKGLKGKDLLSSLGDDLVKEVVRASLERYQAQPQAFERPAQPKPPTTSDRKIKSLDEVWDEPKPARKLKKSNLWADD